eukprot:gene8575-7825_t
MHALVALMCASAQLACGSTPAIGSSQQLAKGGGSCSGIADCHWGGGCVQGVCKCDVTWTGPQCAQLDLLDVVPGTGMYPPAA